MVVSQRYRHPRRQAHRLVVVFDYQYAHRAILDPESCQKPLASASVFSRS